jgi:hypothetical protein
MKYSSRRSGLKPYRSSVRLPRLIARTETTPFAGTVAALIESCPLTASTRTSVRLDGLVPSHPALPLHLRSFSTPPPHCSRCTNS